MMLIREKVVLILISVLIVRILIFIFLSRLLWWDGRIKFVWVILLIFICCVFFLFVCGYMLKYEKCCCMIIKVCLVIILLCNLMVLVVLMKILLFKIWNIILLVWKIFVCWIVVLIFLFYWKYRWLILVNLICWIFGDIIWWKCLVLKWLRVKMINVLMDLKLVFCFILKKCWLKKIKYCWLVMVWSYVCWMKMFCFIFLINMLNMLILLVICWFMKKFI